VAGTTEPVRGRVFLDKLTHAALFGVLGLLWARGYPGRAAAALVAAGGVGFGVLMELFQDRFVPGRSGSPEDVAADAVGLVLGVAAAAWASRPSRKP
jgi:VanZ family protein